MNELAIFSYDEGVKDGLGKMVTPGESFLYVVEMVGNCVKVGISVNPKKRLEQHSRDASAFGIKVGRCWISPVPHGNARDNEKKLKMGSAREYINRDFFECALEASRFPFIRLDKEKVEAELNRSLEVIKNALFGHQKYKNEQIDLIMNASKKDIFTCLLISIGMSMCKSGKDFDTVDLLSIATEMIQEFNS